MLFSFSSKGNLPRHNNSDTTYILQSRNSVYCVHREVRPPIQTKRGAQVVHDDSFLTKSCILGFRSKHHAERIRVILNDYQRQGRIIDGSVSNGIMHIENSTRGRPVSNLVIHSYLLENVEKQCLMNYMDLWLVHDIVRTASDDESGNGPSLRFDVYEYETIEPPHRSYINHQLERQLRNYMR